MKKFIMVIITLILVASHSFAQEIKPNFARLTFYEKTSIASMNIAFTIVDDSEYMVTSPLIRSTFRIGNIVASDRIDGSQSPSSETDNLKWATEIVRPAVKTDRIQCPAIYDAADPKPLTPLGSGCTDRGASDDPPILQCDYVLTIHYDGSPARSCKQALSGVDLENLTLVVGTQAVSQDGTLGDVRETLYALQPAINDDGPT
jgi:hypothetical protein